MFYIDLLFPLSNNLITYPQIEHIWVYPLNALSNMDDTTTTEAAKSEDVDIVICIRANSLGL